MQLTTPCALAFCVSGPRMSCVQEAHAVANDALTNGVHMQVNTYDDHDIFVRSSTLSICCCTATPSQHVRHVRCSIALHT